MLYETIARGWEEFVDRLGGPMSFRFLMQPAIAILFALRQSYIFVVRDFESEFVAGKDAAVLEGRVSSLHRRCDLRRHIPSRHESWHLRVGIANHGDHFGAGAVHGRTDLTARVARWTGVGKPTDRSLPNDIESQI